MVCETKARKRCHGTAMVGPGARCALDGRQDLRFRIGCVDPSDAKARGPVVTVCRSTDFPVFTPSLAPWFLGRRGDCGVALMLCPRELQIGRASCRERV